MRAQLRAIFVDAPEWTRNDCFLGMDRSRWRTAGLGASDLRTASSASERDNPHHLERPMDHLACHVAADTGKILQNFIGARQGSPHMGQHILSSDMVQEV